MLHEMTRSENEQKVNNEDEESSAESDSEDSEKMDVTMVEVSHHQKMPSGVLVDNSKDVQVGTRLNYNGPVTINQYVKSTSIPDVAMVHGAKTPETVCVKPEMDVQRERRIWMCACVALVLLALGVFLFFLFNKTGDVEGDAEKAFTIKYVGVGATSLKGGHYIYSRMAWGSYPPLKPIPARPQAASLVVIGSNEGDNCRNFETCSEEAKDSQYYQMHERAKGTYPDIIYNFMVGGDGNVYEGRGWDNQSYLPLADKILSIGFLGKYNVQQEELNLEQINATQELINYGVELKKITSDYLLIRESQVRDTNSPGFNVVKEISTWPHWDPTYRVVKVNKR